MVLDVFKSAMMLLSSVVVCTQAFWWSSPTTQSPPSLKQIPIGYFRTYTYQPLTYPGSYSSYSYIGSHQSVASPFLGWNQRQTTSISNPAPGLSGLHMPASMPSNMPPQQSHPILPATQPPQYPAHSTPSPTIQHQQTEAQTPSPPVDNKQQQDNAGVPRPKYSPPDPYNFQYQYPSPSSQSSYQPQVQFVPCMCPVTVTVSDSVDGRSSGLGDDFEEQNDLLSSKEENH